MRRSLLVSALLALSTSSARADMVGRACAHDGTGYAMLGFGALVICLYLLIRYAAVHFERVREAQLSVPVPISLLVAERIARAMQRRAGVIATVGIVGVPALVVMHIASLSVLSTIVGCIGLRSFFIARSVLQLIERSPLAAAVPGEAATGEAATGEPRPGVAPTTAGALGRTVIVRSGDAEVSLNVSPRTLAAALRHAVPTSIAKLR